MLSMKTLRVAIAAFGSALLLVPVAAFGKDIKLDSIVPAERAPVTYALETLSGDPNTVLRTRYYDVASPPTAPDADPLTGLLTLSVNTNRRISQGETVYLRIDLGPGLIYNNDPQDQADRSLVDADSTQVPNSSGLVSGTEAVVAGGDDEDFVVYQVDTTSIVADDTTIMVDVSGDIGVVAEAGSYSATISAYDDVNDAAEGVRPRASLFAGSGTIINVVNGLDAGVAAGAPAHAEVSVGFLWFEGPNPAQPLTGQAKLGWFNVREVEFPGGAGKPLSADDGLEIEGADLVAAGGIDVEITGDLSIGAFTLLADTATVAPSTMTGLPTRSEACPKGSPTSINQGSLEDGDKMKLIDEDGVNNGTDSGVQTFSLPAMPATGLVRDVWSLCVDVDYRGPETNEDPMQNSEFTATIAVQAPDSDVSREAASGTIGVIQRNGASVEIAYLTVSEKYNQRLIIANRGNAPAMFDLGGFTTEDGTMVDLSDEAKAARDAGMNVVPANGQLVLRVADLLEFSGDRARAAATLSLNARSHHIQVATTQVNLEDGSTDTVVYTTQGGSGI